MSTFNKIKLSAVILCATIIFVKVALFPASMFAAFAAITTLITIAAE